MVDNDPLNRIQQLHQMKVEGLITDDDYERAKAKLLHGTSDPRTPAVIAGGMTADDILAWIKRPLQHYADFNGRSRRKEYWLFQLIWLPITLAIVLTAGLGLFKLATVILLVAIFGLFIPQLALQVRRFHDQDKSGWFALFNLIPYAGVIVILIFMAIEGTRGDNQYGPDPKQQP